MKKSLLLGAAALAAVAAAPSSADAGEARLSGYYMFRMINADDTIIKDAAGTDDANYWAHRVQLNMDFVASPKTHAHVVTRVIDSGVVEGADSSTLGSPNQVGSAASGTIGATNAGGSADVWEIRQAWLETELFGLGLKVGNMPITLNDGVLVNHDGSSFGTIMLSKTFGDMTLVAADVRVREDNTGNGTANTSVNNAVTAGGSDDDDEDLYVLSLLGSAGMLDYQATVAYLDTGSSSDTSNGAFMVNTADDTNDLWVALTLGGEFSGVNLTGTLIYESGLDGASASNTVASTTAAAAKRLEGGDFMVALRANGATGFGGWDGYAFYAGEDFTNISADNVAWSPTWDMGGPGAEDLLATFASGTNVSSSSENMWGIGAGLTLNAGGWKIMPRLDYAAVVEDTINYGATTQALYDDAWGGSLYMSTEIDTGTTLNIGGTMVDTSDGPGVAAATTSDTMHFLQASIKMRF